MAGVTDRPFRQLCKKLGAGMAVSEMVTSNSLLYGSAKTAAARQPRGRGRPDRVQIAGADPAMMAEAARYNVDRGAQIIDINMGCPAKKVCNVMAGSALLQDEPLVGRILEAVVKAVPEVPVTLKIRTGWDRTATPQHPAYRRGRRHPGAGDARPHPRLRLHRRSRIRHHRAVKAAARIPVIANGDITTPEKAKHVLEYTGADAVMIGRAAQGRPWMFREIEHFLATGEHLPAPEVAEIHAVLLEHLDDLYRFTATHRGAHGAQAHRLVHPGLWPQRLPPCHEPARRPGAQLDAVNEFFWRTRERVPSRLRYETVRQRNSARRHAACFTAGGIKGSFPMIEENELAACVRRRTDQLFQGSRRRTAGGIYDMVLNCSRKTDAGSHPRPRRQATRAAPPTWLSINRNTLRKKMQQHGIKMREHGLSD
jgi:tRNA-dihydrouridine synthase B